MNPKPVFPQEEPDSRYSSIVDLTLQMMKKKTFQYFFGIIWLSASLFIILSTGSCRKEDEKDDDQRVIDNITFHNLMKEWYFWYNHMPEIDPSLYMSPYQVLEQLRYTQDPWSFITTKESFEAYYSESKYVGHGFGSGWDDEGNLRISFVFEATDMYASGVRRSWIIEAINDQVITEGDNVNQLLGPDNIGVTNKFRLIKPDNETVELVFEKKEITMNAVLHSEVIDLGGEKTGYIVYKGFTEPSKNEIEDVFSEFLNEGIDNLILDLRYNSGGQTNIANYLASSIGGVTVFDEPFTGYVYNDKQSGQNYVDSFDVTDFPLNKDRLVTITTRATASASEMVINGLKPYMPVKVVGNNTSGKPMGMNVWFYRDYAFVPITFKIVNAEGEGEFFDGLPADAYVDDDLTRMFGDPEELSLKEALNYIETGSFSALPVKKTFPVQPLTEMKGFRRIIGAH